MASIVLKPNIEKPLVLENKESSREVFSKFVLANFFASEERYIELKTKNLRMSDSGLGYWRFNPIVSNLPRSGGAGYLTVTELRTDGSEGLQAFSRFLLAELASVVEQIPRDESVYIKFDCHYDLHAQTQFQHFHRKFGETGNYAIVGAVVKRLL